MEKNIGKMDRNFRMLLGFAIIATGLVFQSWWGLIGLVPIITGLVNWCPAYSIFRINTCRPYGMKDSCGTGEAGLVD